MSKPVFNKVNLVCGDFDASLAFYRRLGVEIPESAVWRTRSGGHHANALDRSSDQAIQLDLDSSAFAQIWNSGWKDRSDLKGRVVIGFFVPDRNDVDEVFDGMMVAGYRALQEPDDAFWGARYAIIEDPDGIAVCVMSPKSSDWKSSPPAL